MDTQPLPSTGTHLRDQLLIAMPGMLDPNFDHSVVYLCEHGEQGAMGLTINRPLGIELSEILDQLELSYGPEPGAMPLLNGGPVEQQRGFVLHTHSDREWQATIEVSTEISLTSSRDILEAIAASEGPRASLVALGYAGWGPGQLEQELLANAWLTVPASPALLFDTPLESRAAFAAAKIGVDLAQLSASTGHA